MRSVCGDAICCANTADALTHIVSKQKMAANLLFIVKPLCFERGAPKAAPRAGRIVRAALLKLANLQAG
jgi:hypothetical protein